MKLLIVDDERRTRELLQNYIPWDAVGIGEVETARNGLQALEIAEALQPDIILCDIRMPKMSGIEFAQAYRKTDPDCQLIFLSGFSDKEYLKSAIQLKAFTYIDKPVNLNEVRDAVEQAVWLRREEQKRKEEEQKLQEGFDRSLPYLRQEMVRRLISDPDSPNVVPALKSRETFLLPMDGPFTVVASSLYWNPSDLSEDAGITQQRILETISGHTRFQELRALAGFDSNNLLVLVMPGTYGSAYTDGRAVIEELLAELRALAGPSIDLRMGVGNPISSRSNIPESYRLAYQACAYQYYGSGAKPIFPDALRSHAPVVMNWEEVRLLRDHLRVGQVDEAKRIVHEWTAYARKQMDLDIMRLKDTYFQLLAAAMETAVQLGLAEISEDTERRYMWKEIDRIPSLDALEQYVLSFLDSMAKSDEEMASAGSGKIREITRYIHAHFHERGFTIRAIADHVQLSETYLCACFKKHHKQTIKEYIMDTRVDKAKELLSDPKVKIIEVAMRVGISDSNYFTIFFKRKAGCTPSEYRERAIR
ncbi:response regulator [Paenibacillus sp. PR3]|uniref:Response regulator n=1 Tax=Paenibacillus terricola TaxID=2763503 RepID=A0ABR8MMK3_9BACL|nr:response regulator [Paenibacillus terricola]MBD3917244.1 response regulator [Paenibacillus terricola]